MNQNLTSMTPTLIAPGTQVVLTCNLSDLPDFLGHNVMIIANFTYGESGSSVLSLYNVMVPYFEITNVSFDTFSLGNPYMNVTVHNSELSKINATITQVSVKTENVTILIDGTVSNPSTSPVGYLLQKGSETTFVCPWNWSLFVGKVVTVIVQSSDGFQASTPLKV